MQHLHDKEKMNKSFLTNLTAVLITFIGLFPIYNEIIFFTGLFALSGSITNWLAVYMLFDKVPFIYGSGVIPRNFVIFKAGIRNIVMQEFFAGDNFEIFVKQNNESLKTKIETNINFETVFLKLTEAIEESSLGGLLGMIGGKEALNPLKEPIKEKLLMALSEQFETSSLKNNEGYEVVKMQLEKLIDDRLDEIGPQEVKVILKKMIDKHLGWLVLWGGVFGGVIGLTSTTIMSKF